MRKWIIPAVLGILAIGAVAIWGNTHRLANRQMEIFLDNKYQRAFFDLASQVQQLEVLLSKSMVAADPRLDLALLMDLRQQAAFAQSNLSQLPLGDALASRTSEFLTQLGDYGNSLARQISRGEAISKDQWESLNNLYQQCVDLNRELQGMSYKVAQNNFYFSELVRQVRKNLQDTSGNAARSDLQALDQRMQNYPSLIYDGPFSEHLEKAEPKALSGQAEIDRNEAVNRALAFVDKDPNLEYKAVVTGDTNGRIPAYRVEVSAGEGDAKPHTQLDVSKQGGRVIWMLQPRFPSEQAISIDEARQKALRFLKERDFGEMKPTYYMQQENTVTLNFAAVQDGVTLYPDLVKVTVALDNGEIIGAETTGYLMSHQQRDLPEIRISREQARAEINPRLEVTGGELALIPVGAADEKLTYEFRGKLGEETYLIYINAENGREENILKLIETENGTLTM
ncbi:MAG TPA: germination protein YpeB [Bacillota bacterium]|nr:germination protein YpeB [Peptococcaceae bacterium MAG4]NLW37691.1 germination protein YpeB [Peptococcaceae bacterium]HPZ42758.1 germination protein YpeB [Bacillota bacterium]HQD75451.1 germination protein YpeB [Bacillota bacterium]HUM59111.1 germination protein YpeB [Bacillota bacterium]